MFDRRSGYPQQCIIPPHMLDVLKQRGDARVQRMVRAIEAESRQMRDSREDAAPPDAFEAAPRVAPSKCVPKREVYDGQGRVGLPGKPVRAEGRPATADGDVSLAYDGAGASYELFSKQYSRCSLDGHGMPIVSTVHHRRRFNNAFWDGSQMVYGDGDGVIFQPFVRSLTVIGHELSHGVVQFSGGLVYRDQSGALNESAADVFGCLTEQFKLGQSAVAADWLVGKGILGPGINGDALRSMKAPGLAYNDPLLGKDPQPFHMSQYVVTFSDNGGVHINSGIPNQAFYLLAQYLGGNAWERAGHIWYDTLQEIQDPLATFQDWAGLTVACAGKRFGQGSLEQQFTRRAWRLVGIVV